MGERLKLNKISFLLSLLAGLFITIISFYGFSLLRDRPGIPGDIDKHQIVRIDNFDIRVKKDIEFSLRTKTIGDPAEFYLKTDGKIEKRVASIAPYYTKANFPLIYFIIGLFCFFIGTAVFLLRPRDLKARLFYWTMLAFAPALIISGDNYCLRREWLSFIPCMLFIVSYALVPAFMVNFSLAFAKGKYRLNRFVIFLPALLIAGVQESTFLYAYLKPSVDVYRFYHSTYFIFRFYVVIYVLFSIFQLSLSYRKAELDEERAQIQWIFYGLIVGLLPFIVLYMIPSALGLRPLLSEEISAVFFFVIPAAFAIAIIRYKLMNIEVVINRSLVYSLLTIFIVSLYLIFVQISERLFSKFFVVHEIVFSAIGVFLAAAAFQPALKKIQDFVDKAFFRQRFDYRQTVLAFSDNAQRFVSQDELLDYFIQEIKRVIPVERLSISVGSESVVGQEKNFVLIKGDELSFHPLQTLNHEAPEISARRAGVQTEENIDFSKEKILEENRLEIGIPLAFPSGGRNGFLLLGKKKSGARFAREDIELIRTMANELALNLDRLKLQEEVIYERASREKLDELNRLKTEFITTVSHELRTPMSSIQGLAEILQSGKVKDKEKREQFLHLMASESSRLSRFLHNVLDFGKIEQQVKIYHFHKTDIVTLIHEVVAVFQQTLDGQGFTLDLHLPPGPRFLEIDEDSVKQALINLIDNAIKYSTDKKVIEIGLQDREREMEIQVKDQGIGIPMGEQEKIFDKFYRVAQTGKLCPKGAGLGLKIIKHIMAAHRGDVRVTSEVGKGSTFMLVFPKP
jgi:signal transduction histidine kinase